MRPSRIQYFLAHAVEISTIGGALILAVVAGWASGGFSVWSVLAVLIALPLGCIAGLLFFGPFLFFIAGKLNGSPFHEGDKVRILVGPHRDRVSRVYAIWEERNQVRVDLGEERKERVMDVFGYNQICRERDA